MEVAISLIALFAVIVAVIMMVMPSGSEIEGYVIGGIILLFCLLVPIAFSF